MINRVAFYKWRQAVKFEILCLVLDVFYFVSTGRIFGIRQEHKAENLNYYRGWIKTWRRAGLLHREGAPAKVWPDGHQQWFRYGRVHRADGPAIITKDGEYGWWFNGWKCYDMDEWLDVNYKLDESDKTLMKLTWG